MNEPSAPFPDDKSPANDTASDSSRNVASASETSPARRSFLAAAVTVAAAAGALAVPVATAVVSFLNPLRQKSGAGRLLKLADLAMLPEDGSPRVFPVVADHTDAWTRAANQVIGKVFLRRTGDAAQPVAALQVYCPHAGCSITYRRDGDRFFCPCHASSFDLAGRRTEEASMSPRDMDALEVEIRNQQEVWVKYENFRAGTAEKIAEA